LIAGGYGAVKGVVAFSKLIRAPVQVSRVTAGFLKETSAVHKGIKAKQIWTSTKKRTSVQNAFKHWKDHGNEFPEILNSKQYVEQSHNFFVSRDRLLTKIRPNGEIIVYDAQSNVFGAFTNEGIPKTMFKPSNGILYWERN
jgi:pyocin large subunit-like protein